MYGIPLEQVSKAQRSVGKTQNFAVLYGAGEDKIAQVAGTSIKKALKLIDGYYDGFPMFEPWSARSSRMRSPWGTGVTPPSGHLSC